MGLWPLTHGCYKISQPICRDNITAVVTGFLDDLPPPPPPSSPPSLPLSHFRANCDRILWYAHLTFNPYSTDILFSLTHDVSFSEYDVSSSVSARSLKLSNAGPVTYWMGDRLRLPGGVCTRTCVQRCRVIGLREPRKSDDSSDWPRVGRKINSMDVGAVSIQRDPQKIHHAAR